MMAISALPGLSLCLQFALSREEQRLDRLRAGLEARGSPPQAQADPPGPGQRGAAPGHRPDETPTEEDELRLPR